VVGVEPTSLNLAQGSAGTRGAVLFRPISGHNYIPDPRLRSVLGCIGTDKFAEPFEKEKDATVPCSIYIATRGRGG